MQTRTESWASLREEQESREHGRRVPMRRRLCCLGANNVAREEARVVWAGSLHLNEIHMMLPWPLATKGRKRARTEQSYSEPCPQRGIWFQMSGPASGLYYTRAVYRLNSEFMEDKHVVMNG
jgi:hypothetical protein